MAKDDNGGLLSKVVKFVRNPATNWSDLDQPEQERDSGNSKQLLKEMVERKKSNDFVRKREFDMLRKLRRREASDAQPTLRPSFFQSSLPSKPDERALTIKKIDEIEAQMSMQWWKTKQRDSAVEPGQSAPPQPRIIPPPAHVERPMLEPMSWSDLSSTPIAPSRPPLASSLPVSRPVTPLSRPVMPPVAAPFQAGPASAPVVRPLVPPPAVAAPAPAPVAPAPLNYNQNGLDFMASKNFGIEVGEIAHDPELEEASIRFANGDDQGAEAGLMEALDSGGARTNHVETWLTLFDLHRATGHQAQFDVAAMDFANRFQRSAPQWFSMPEMVEQLVAAKPAPSGPQSAHWSCPPLLGVKSVGTLTDVLARTSPPWRLDWTRLAAIEPTALPTLVKLLHGWADQPIELSLTGADQLEKMLENGSPSGDATVAPDWWHARMALLRVMSRMDDFELAALNYCVTYEVSPPSWEHPRCTCDFTSGDSHERGGPVTIISSTFDLPSDGARDAGHSDFRSTGMESELLPPLVVELSGSIAGDVSSTLMTLESKFAGADTLTISCSKLIRVDFAAAGTLLNWVSALHSQGRQVQFKGVHRLILGFFNVIGISELARITVRTD